MDRLTFTDQEMKEIQGLTCPVKDSDLVSKFCERICDEFNDDCPYMEMGIRLKYYEDLFDQRKAIVISVPKQATDFRRVIQLFFSHFDETYVECAVPQMKDIIDIEAKKRLTELEDEG